MFQIFMMVTNGLMCFMSSVSFVRSIYDTYCNPKTAATHPEAAPHKIVYKIKHLGPGTDCHCDHIKPKHQHIQMQVQDGEHVLQGPQGELQPLQLVGRADVAGE